MLGAGGVSGTGGVEPPTGPQSSGPLQGSDSPASDVKPGNTMGNLRNYFKAKMGEEKGEKMYNEFILSTFVMPMIQQMQKDQQKLKEIQDQMMG